MSLLGELLPLLCTYWTLVSTVYTILTDFFFLIFICSCYKCQAFYFDLTRLQAHLHSHPKDAIANVCVHCGKSFAYYKNLFFHMIGHMPEHERPVYECYLCKNSFKTKGSLQKHMKLHIGGKYHKAIMEILHFW